MSRKYTKKQNRPLKEDLEKWPSPEAAAEYYGTSLRTMKMWLRDYDLWKPKPNFGPNKLSEEQIEKILELHSDGMPIKSIAKQFGVTFSTISKIIKKFHAQSTAQVSVVYNPASCSKK